MPLTKKRPAEQRLIDDDAPLVRIGLRKGGDAVTVPSAQTGLLRHLDDAIRLMPTCENDAYIEAMRSAPSLVEKESNPMNFIRYEKFNIWTAARRLALYWKTRKELFGPDAFLKPMHLTGSGALSSDDIAVLETGAVCILPRTGSSGQRVLWWDREKLSSAQLSQSKSRICALFYILQLFMEDEGTFDDDAKSTSVSVARTSKEDDSPTRNKTEGIFSLTVLACFPASFGGKSDFDFTQKVGQVVSNCFPIEVKAIHLVSGPTNRGTTIIAGIVIQILGKLFAFLQMRIHMGSTMKELQQKLREAGFDKRNLPVKVGGYWKDEKFEQFKRRRKKIEEEMFLSEEEKLQRKRQVNMIHSRQKRERRKIEFEVLQDQSQRLVSQNSMLRVNIERLEALLEQASKEVFIIEQRSRSGGVGNKGFNGGLGMAPSTHLGHNMPPILSPGFDHRSEISPAQYANVEALRRFLNAEQTSLNLHPPTVDQTSLSLELSRQIQQLLSAHTSSSNDAKINMPTCHEQQHFPPFIINQQNVSDTNRSPDLTNWQTLGAGTPKKDACHAQSTNDVTAQNWSNSDPNFMNSSDNASDLFSSSV